MTRTKTNVIGGKGEALPEAVVEAPARGRVDLELEVVLVVRQFPEVVDVEQHQ